MTKAGPHDNGGDARHHISLCPFQSHKVTAYCDVHIHLGAPT